MDEQYIAQGLVGLVFIFVISIGVFGLPLMRIIQRAGLNQLLFGFIAIPFLGIFILLGILAFSTWPKEPEGYR